MYMTKVIISWPAYRNPYDWHKLLWGLFPGQEEREFQFACMDARPGRELQIVMISTRRPLEKNSAALTVIGEPKHIANVRFREGQRLRFSLTANPTKIVTEQTGNRRKVRVPLIREANQRNWLARKLDKLADIDTLTVQPGAPIYFRRKGRPGKVVPVIFEGILRVRDPLGFRDEIWTKREKQDKTQLNRYIAGLGPAKAFGCGLMLIKRP